MLVFSMFSEGEYRKQVHLIRDALKIVFVLVSVKSLKNKLSFKNKWREARKELIN